MTCDHCVRSVRSALEGCAGVERATVDLQSGLAAVTGQDVDYNVLRRAVEKVGYGAEPADAGTDTDPASGRHGA